MPFDPQLIEAKLALGRIGPDEMPALACDALEAGFDGPSIRRLAALITPSGWETDQILPAFMAEAGLKKVSSQVATLRLARQLAQRILTDGLDPLAYSRDFELLWIEADYLEALQGAGSLDDRKAIAEYVGQSESELREEARRALNALVAASEPSPTSDPGPDPKRA